MSMTRPPAVNALFAGHSLPRTAKALDQIRGHITRLEANQNNGKPAQGPCAPWRSDYDPAAVKRGPVPIDDKGEA